MAMSEDEEEVIFLGCCIVVVLSLVAYGGYWYHGYQDSRSDIVNVAKEISITGNLHDMEISARDKKSLKIDVNCASCYGPYQPWPKKVAKGDLITLSGVFYICISTLQIRGGAGPTVLEKGDGGLIMLYTTGYPAGGGEIEIQTISPCRPMTISYRVGRDGNQYGKINIKI